MGFESGRRGWLRQVLLPVSDVLKTPHARRGG
jgi:hypothetical protein